jgi:SAM-dependent methyltransferase
MLPWIKRAEMRIRAIVPSPVRNIYRISRALTAAPRSSPPIPGELLADCRMCPDRFDLIGRLPKDGIVAELGTYKGHFAKEILARAQPQILHLIDIDFSLTERSVMEHPKVQCHNGLTVATLADFPDGYFDWIYIDADHSYDGVVRDARASAAKLKPGGYLVFNDFAHIDPQMGRYGVQQAVVEFACAERWPFAFFAYDGAALYDVALRNLPMPAPANST